MAAGGVEARGAIFTRPEVVDFILDLVGYTTDRPLHQQRILEPSFGGGDFLTAVIQRLIAAWRADGGTRPVEDLSGALRAVELHAETSRLTGEKVERTLIGLGLTEGQASKLRGRWLVQADFLLADLDGKFDYVVGNPPYVRQELIPDALVAEYRRRYATMYDRADIYVPFIERSLNLLRPGGVLGFICADRWMKNRYGGPLRKLVGREYALKAYVDMVNTPAFLSDVVAYPGVFIIGSEPPTTTQVARRPAITREALNALVRPLRGEAESHAVRTIAVAATDGAPWLVGEEAGSDLVRRLEATLPALEATGCKVGIGVATGADKAFIGPYMELDVEPDRKVPLVMTRDINGGSIVWRGMGVINPFADGGGLVDLASYPRLRGYLEARRSEIAGRHVAQKAPANWYRTIDRIYPALVHQPKLLIPDIKGEAHIVYDEGAYYPHHNLYYVTSAEWDLRALQAVLLSSVTRLFIETYATRMRGGYLRFQAQYLRRLRLPYWTEVPEPLRAELIAAAHARDRTRCDAAAAKLYGLTAAETAALAVPGNAE